MSEGNETSSWIAYLRSINTTITQSLIQELSADPSSNTNRCNDISDAEEMNTVYYSIVVQFNVKQRSKGGRSPM